MARPSNVTRGVLAFWVLFACLAPIALLQALWARHRTPRLPEATGPDARTSEDIMVLGIGESTIAGVGVASLDEALTARVADALAERTSRAVGWKSFGRNGDRVHDIISALPGLPEGPYDIVVVALGVNDTTGLTSLDDWRMRIETLAVALRERFRAPVVFAEVPPLQLFPALPQPLRMLLGARAILLDRVLGDVARDMEGVHHARVGFARDPELIAGDGYHPSAMGYASWGQSLADDILRIPWLHLIP